MIDCERYHASLFVPDVSAAVEFYTKKLGFSVGFTYGEPPKMAGVTLGGYLVSFGQYNYSTGPRVEIERVDVPVRVEKRLAAALSDLAEHKHMSLSSCLEETRLHTFEPLGDGVASPHTQSDLRYIQQLKKKPDIDYDSHASYRFVER